MCRRNGCRHLEQRSAASHCTRLFQPTEARLGSDEEELLGQVEVSTYPFGSVCSDPSDFRASPKPKARLAAERLELDAQLISQELPLLTSSPLQGIPQLVLKASRVLKCLS